MKPDRHAQAAIDGFDVLKWATESHIKFHRQDYSSPEVRFLCPVCESDGGGKGRWLISFNVEKRSGHCHRCGEGFTLLRFLATSLSISEMEALALVFRKSDAKVGKEQVVDALDAFKVQDAEESVPEEEEIVRDGVQLPEGFIPYRPWPFKNPWYFSQRGITEEDALIHRLGWCSRGRFANRLVLPVYTRGRLVTFSARYMGNVERDSFVSGEEIKPYLYPVGPRSRALFNYDRAIHCGSVCLVEGCFDAIRVGAPGMAVLGNKLTAGQVELIASADIEDVVMMFDGDAAGKELARVCHEKLDGIVPSIRYHALPPGKDPDEFPRRQLDRWRAEARPYGGGEELDEALAAFQDPQTEPD